MDAVERALEIVDERRPDAYGFTVKARANGRLHRVEPARDPQQPRFWCIVVYRCSAGGLPDAAERPWVGPGNFRREELKAAFGAIRDDPEGWLAEDERAGLRAWMLDPAAPPPPTLRR